MTGILPLIVSEEPVSRGLLARAKLSKPNIAVVYSDGFGQITYLGGRPLSWSEQVASRYRTRYEVDLSDHRRQASLESSPLPSRGDMYFFRSIVDVGFRVTDPAAVVRRHVTDGLVVVYNFLIDAFRPVTRQYDITDAQGAEEELNRTLLNPVELPEGITIYRCTTRLTLDGAAQQYLRGLASAQRSMALDTAKHGVDVAATRHAQVIDDMKQQARLAREELELTAMAGRPVDLPSILRAHLVRHPDETQYVTELLVGLEQARQSRSDADADRTQDLVRYMAERGLIQSVDIEKWRTKALDRLAELAGPDPSAEQVAQAASSWNDPLDNAIGAGAPLKAIPVYVIVDESVADPSYFDALNNSIKALPSELAVHQDIVGAVRLALIGYAGGVDVRMPLNAIAASSFVPAFSHHDGRDLTAVFDDLYSRIPADIKRLKSTGLTPGRPVVHLLCATPTDDSPALIAAFRRLTDPSAFPYVPTIIPCGIGPTPPESVGRLATHARLAWVAAPGTPVSEATTYYLAFVRTSIVGLSQAHLRGDGEFVVTGPTGFRSAASPP